MKKLFVIAGLLAVLVFGGAAADSVRGAVPPLKGDMPMFVRYSGEIQEVNKENGFCKVLVKDENGNPFYFVIGEDTFNLDAELVKGEKVVGFTLSNRAEIMIWPPQHFADVILKQPENLFVKADYFDKDLVSKDGMLKLNRDKSTVVCDKAGNSLTEIPSNSALLVFYGPTTRSIPAITTPQKVIVLNQK